MFDPRAEEAGAPKYRWHYRDRPVNEWRFERLGRDEEWLTVEQMVLVVMQRLEMLADEPEG